MWDRSRRGEPRACLAIHRLVFEDGLCSPASDTVARGICCGASFIATPAPHRRNQILQGDIITCLEQRRLKGGQLRIRSAHGWVSLVARDGTVLFEPGCTPSWSDLLDWQMVDDGPCVWDVVSDASSESPRFDSERTCV